MRDGGVIRVKVPRHWSRALKASAIEELVEKIRKKNEQEQALLNAATTQERITIHNQAELEAFIRRINAETFNAPLGKIRIGYSRYNHLAQVNLRTKTLTVSRYCLNNAPQEALRYLIVHELAHYYESGHGPKFWALVARHVPDYKRQSSIIKAFHHQAVISEETKQPTPAASTPETPVSFAASKPPAPPVAKAPPQKESRRWAGLFKQLLLWD